MKRLALSLALAAAALVSAASDRDHVAISATPMFFPQGEYTNGATYTFELTGMYMRDVGRVLHFGAGGGIGVSDPDYHHLNSDRENIIQFPVFARAKVDFGTAPSHFYAAIKTGTRLAHGSDYDFNPYIWNITPGIGYDINIGGHNLGIEFIMDMVWGRQSCYYWSGELHEILWDDDDTVSYTWTQIGLSFTFEF